MSMLFDRYLSEELPYKVEDIKFLWEQLQYILFDKED